jgi:hypothetical protein
MCYKSLFWILCAFLLIASASVEAADTGRQPSRMEIADFLGVSTWEVGVECPQKTFFMKGDGKEAEMTFCLNPEDKENRCEIAIDTLQSSPSETQISFDIKTTYEIPEARWHSIMQIHEFPDKGEAWRCPPFTIEVSEGKFRAFSRWDEKSISRTHGYNCTEEGSSIQGRTVVEGIPAQPDIWQNISLKTRLSPYSDGWMRLRIGENSEKLTSGGNSYNDKRTPYVKLGIYKPAGWTEKEKKRRNPVCASYRNVNIVSSGIQ